MYRPRIIPVLLLQGNALVKSVKFKNHRYIGDPINAVRIFNDLFSDELVFLDINANKENRTIPVNFVKNVGEEANMPFSVGGGIKTLKDIETILNAGAEKIILNSSAVSNPEFIRQASNTFGSSTIVVCIDYKKPAFSGLTVYCRSGRLKTKYSPIEFAILAEEMGAGEIILQSIANDGQMGGYDIPTIKLISDSVKVPVIALGGAGSLEHVRDAYQHAKPSALAAGSLFVFQGNNKGVLINYPDKKEKYDVFRS